MANIITAGNSTNGGTAISTDTSGTLNIVTGSGSGSNAMTIDTSQAITMPGNLTVTGTLTASKGISGTPAFSVYKSAAQTLSSATFTKITFNTEEFDTNNNFASSAFTPTVAGYYQINGNVSNGTGTQTVASIYKNGTIYKDGNNASSFGAVVSTIVYLNGSTDYVELYGYFATGTNTGSGISSTWFNGSLVRGA
jgi:hypothetical protein